MRTPSKPFLVAALLLGATALLTVETAEARQVACVNAGPCRARVVVPCPATTMHVVVPAPPLRIAAAHPAPPRGWGRVRGHWGWCAAQHGRIRVDSGWAKK